MQKRNFSMNVGGRPRSISITAQAGVVAQLETVSGFKTKQKAFLNALATAADKTLVERNVPRTCGTATSDLKLNRINNMSPKTVKRYEKIMQVKSGKGEATTKARAKACTSVRNMLSFAAANDLIGFLSHPSLLSNSDATTFEVGDSRDNIKIIVKYLGKRCDQGSNLKVELDENVPTGISAYFIKYYLHCSADGLRADPVFVVQSPNMEAGAIDVKIIEGFGVSTSVHGKGYLVFVKSRACNIAFYQWYNTNILIPYVLLQRSKNNLPLTTPAFHQLQSTTKRSTIQNSFKEVGIYPYSFEKIFSNFTDKMKGKPTYDDQLYYKKIMDELKAIILEKGEISDADFDRLNINDEFSCNKDGLIVSQRRTVILTNMALIKSELAKIDAKKAAAAATEIKRQLAKDKKIAKVNAAELRASEPAVAPPIDGVLPVPKKRKRQVPGVGVGFDERAQAAPSPRAKKSKLAVTAVVASPPPPPLTYCYCKCLRTAVDQSPMVQCANAELCPHGEWFHYSHASRIQPWEPEPDSEWYCTPCENTAAH